MDLRKRNIRLVNLIVILFVTLGTIIFICELYSFYKSGEWNSISFLDLLIYCSSLRGDEKILEIARHPESWWGFHKIFFTFFDSIPVSISFVIVGIITYGMSLLTKKRK